MNTWSDDSIVFWRSNAHGSFGEPELVESSVGEELPTSIEPGDIDGDGDTDILVPYLGVGCNCCGSSECNSPGCRQIVCASAPECCDGWSATCAALAAQDCCCCGAEDCDDRVVWYRNDGNDCNGNRVPDECEPDCNGNGITDACDVRKGTSIDCDGNGIPDECDTGWNRGRRIAQ